MLRRALCEDADRLAALDLLLFDEDRFNARTFHIELEAGASWVWEDEGEICGYALVRPDPEMADLLRLGVAPSWQRMGVGKRLLDQVLSAHPVICLCVNEKNRAARSLYKSRGFVDAGFYFSRGFYSMVRQKRGPRSGIRTVMDTSTNTDAGTAAASTISTNEIVRAALNGTPGGYLQKCLKMRAGRVGDAVNPDRLGSFYSNDTPSGVLAKLLGAEWMQFVHQDVKAPARAYIANLPGIVGLVRLDTLPVEMKVRLDDSKNTGKVEAVASLPGSGLECSYTVLLVGPGDDGEDVIYTFHPGDPVRPSEMDRYEQSLQIPGPGGPTYSDLHGQMVPVKYALARGLVWAKIG